MYIKASVVGEFRHGSGLLLRRTGHQARLVKLRKLKSRSFCCSEYRRHGSVIEKEEAVPCVRKLPRCSCGAKPGPTVLKEEGAIYVKSTGAL